MKAILNRSIHHPLSAPAHGADHDKPLDETPDEADDTEPTLDLLDLFRSRWNCAILRALRLRFSQAPPQLRRHQLN